MKSAAGAVDEITLSISDFVRSTNAITGMTRTVKDIADRRGMVFYVFESVSKNQNDDTVCTATWTNIVRGAS